MKNIERGAMKQALEALQNNRQTHHYCEDTWYSCPKHEDGCANDSEGDECNCGADKANAEIDAAITSLRQAIREAEGRNIAEAEKQEPVCPNIDEPLGCYRIRCQLGRKCVDAQLQPKAEKQETKREWVGMTPTDMEELSATWWWPNENEMALIDWVESKLKEKNT